MFFIQTSRSTVFQGHSDHFARKCFGATNTPPVGCVLYYTLTPHDSRWLCPYLHFFNYLLLVYVMKMSLFDIYYEYELLLKYIFMKIPLSDLMVRSSKKTKSVIFKRCCYRHGLLKHYLWHLIDNAS